MQIENSVFLVTGAGSGLGAATARMFVAAGARVLIADVNRAGGEAVAAELGAQALFSHTDVTDEASARNAVDLAVSRFGALHGLVNCAGIAPAEKVVGRDGPHRLDDGLDRRLGRLWRRLAPQFDERAVRRAEAQRVVGSD